MNPSGDTKFRLDERSLHASALRAQILERCRRTLNHDMNNAVQSIHSGLELLSKCVANPGIVRVSPQECINLLQQQFGNLQNTFRKLLSDIADPPGAPETFDLSALLAEVLQTLRHERGIAKGKIHIDPDLPIHARKAIIRSVAFGVLFDALDHLNSDDSLEITAFRQAHRTRFEVRMRSVNRSPEQPSTQAVSITELLASLLTEEGSELHIEEAGEGRTISMTVPSAQEASAQSEGAADDMPLRVLIADRNQDAADSLAMILQLEGHEAKTLYSGAQLLGTLASFSPHIVLFDSDLSDCDPAEIASAARAARRGRRALLAQVSSSDRTRHAAFDAHLIRPVDWPQLQALLRTTRETS
jgi:CheY-like chemotaxis protein